MVSFRPRLLYPRDPLDRRLGGPRAGLDDVEKKLLTLPRLELDPSAVQPVASRYTDYPIPAPIKTLRLKTH